jgi:hypothetical protein
MIQFLLALIQKQIPKKYPANPITWLLLRKVTEDFKTLDSNNPTIGINPRKNNQLPTTG